MNAASMVLYQAQQGLISEATARQAIYVLATYPFGEEKDIVITTENRHLFITTPTVRISVR